MPSELLDRHRVLAERMAGHQDPEKRLRVDTARARLAGVLALLSSAEDIAREVLAELCAAPAGEPFNLAEGAVAAYVPGVSRVEDIPVDPEDAMRRELVAALDFAGPFATVQNRLARVVDAPGLLGQAVALLLAELPPARFKVLETASAGWAAQPDHEAMAEARLREAVQQLQHTASEAKEAGQELPEGFQEVLRVVQEALAR